MRAARESLSRTIAVACLGAAIAALLLYSLSHRPLLLGLALGGAVAAVAASLSYLVERGRRVARLSASFTAFDPTREPSGRRYSVLLDTDGQPQPAHLWREEALWRLASGGEVIEFQASAPAGVPVMADYELDRFLKEQLQRRHLSLRCCGTCSYFAYAGISRQMSQGWVAYCLRHASGPLLPDEDAVHLWHLCGDWEPGE